MDDGVSVNFKTIMTPLDIKIYNENFVSIKDLSGDLNISDAKWNKFFELLTKVFEGFYFLGNRIWSNIDEYDQTLAYLSEKILIDQGKEHSEILFRLKDSSLIYNRRFASRMWDYYEYPSFVFLGSKENEQILTQGYRNKLFHDDVIERLEEIIVIYRSFEQNVLWIKGDINLAEIIKSSFH